MRTFEALVSRPELQAARHKARNEYNWILCTQAARCQLPAQPVGFCSYADELFELRNCWIQSGVLLGNLCANHSVTRVLLP